MPSGFAETLAQIATDHEVVFALDGSVARQFQKGDEKKAIEDLVPALSDIDFDIKHGSFSFIKSLILNYEPKANFFHMEARSDQNADSFNGGCLEITNSKIWFVPQNTTPDVGIAKAIYTIDDDRNIILLDQTKENWELVFQINLRRNLDLGEIDTFDLILDYVYLISISDTDYTDPIDDYLGIISEQLGVRDSFSMQLTRRKFRRLKMLLLKIIFKKKPKFDIADMVNKFLLPWGYIFFDQGLSDIVEQLSPKKNQDTNLFAIVRPVFENGIWVRDFFKIGNLKTTETLWESIPALAQFENDHGNLIANTPIIRIPTNRPIDPTCCKYTDFERNILEIVFMNPSRIPKNNVGVLVEDSSKETVVTAHNVISGDPRSLKLDYGYLCWLAGTDRFVKVVGVHLKETEIE